MQVMEIYLAPQGEGIFIGEPSVFIRFFGCNLKCVWCDTAYSINPKEWRKANPESKEEPYTEMLVNEVFDVVLQYSTGDTPVVLTGGEPLLQRDFHVLADKLFSIGARVTVETNGTVIPSAWPAHLQLDNTKKQILWSISPKMSSARTAKPDKERLLVFMQRSEPMQLKFVISSVEDFHEALHLLHALPTYAYEPNIVFQPNGMLLDVYGIKKYLEILDWLQQLVIQEVLYKNVRVLPQLHAMIYGYEARGV